MWNVPCNIEFDSELKIGEGELQGISQVETPGEGVMCVGESPANKVVVIVKRKMTKAIQSLLLCQETKDNKKKIYSKRKLRIACGGSSWHQKGA